MPIAGLSPEPDHLRAVTQNVITYQADAKQVIDLNRGMDCRYIILHLQGTPTLTAANNTAAKTKPGDEWAVVKRISIKVNGSTTLYSISGKHLLYINHLLYRQHRTQYANGADNPSMNSTLIMPFDWPMFAAPGQTRLPTGNLSTYTIEVEWGNYTDINADASAWTTQPTVTVYSMDSFNSATQKVTSRLFLYPEQHAVTATTSAYQVDLAVNDVYAGLFLFPTDDGADADDIINKVTVKDAVNTIYQWPVDVIRAQNDARFRLMASESPLLSSTSNQDSWLYVDLASQGLLAEAVDTLGWSNLRVELDVTVGSGTTLIDIIPVLIRPLRG